jgi:hypothetical protein
MGQSSGRCANRAGAVRHGGRNDREESRIGDDGAAGYLVEDDVFGR